MLFFRLNINLLIFTIMTKIELVNVAIENLQRAIADAITEEMPEQGTYVKSIFHIGNADISKDGAIVIGIPSPELAKQAKRLELAVLYEEQKELQNKMDKVSGQIKAKEATV